MATERLSMRKTREILRLKWCLERSHREVAGSLAVSVGVVGATVSRAKAQGLDWAAVQALSDDELDQRLYIAKLAAGAQRPHLGDFRFSINLAMSSQPILILELLRQ